MGRYPVSDEPRALTREDFLRWRDVDDPCLRCDGTGRITYGSTATWRGGIGGQALTADVCDTCWGSGDRYRHGVDLRTLRGEESKRVAEAAVDLLTRSVGAGLRNCYSDIYKIIAAIEALADKERRARKPTGSHFLPELAQALANTLRRAISVTEIKQ